ncbi:hypothetical protein AB1Y20_002490 [Prymnesium parvum]|uniref:Armadillo repeat-containing protein 1 n=1 Tax=Prymnesium parvum TaxID=97485 RepID=A0AB34JAJ6_PRYPA
MPLGDLDEFWKWKQQKEQELFKLGEAGLELISTRLPRGEVPQPTAEVSDEDSYDWAVVVPQRLSQATELLHGHVLTKNQRGAYTLALELSKHQNDEEAMGEKAAFLRQHPVMPALLKLAAEAEDAEHYDRSTMQLCLSCWTNMAYIGLAPDIGHDPSLAQMLRRALLRGRDDEVLLQYVLPAIYNLSCEPAVLDALLDHQVMPLLVALSRMRSTEHAESARYSRNILENIRLYRASLRSTSHCGRWLACCTRGSLEAPSSSERRSSQREIRKEGGSSKRDAEEQLAQQAHVKIKRKTRFGLNILRPSGKAKSSGQHYSSASEIDAIEMAPSNH